MGNPNMEKAKLEASIQWVSKNFSECILIIGDSLYRYTLQITKGMPPEESLDKALLFGEKFIHEHEPLIEKYNRNCIFHWLPTSKLEKNPLFNIYHEKFKKLYRENISYRKIVDNFIGIYLGRVLSDDNLLKEKNLCALNYILEETTLITCLCAEDSYIFVYPGSIKSFIDIAEGVVTNIPKPLLKLVFISLRLKRLKRL
ncbi:MAG: tRNA-dependent cyclodipeptide synthase [Desulfobacteraceae bacterium]|nr:tRNA-dependent cyclodipeptide synthase [Desulfobacteraceae bacterium]